MLQSACPIMPSRDFNRTAAFYGDLGFVTLGRYDDDGYLILKRDEVELHFFHYPAHEPEESDHGVYLRVTDAASLSAEFAALGLPHAGIPRFVPAEAKPWGMMELALIDEDGNLVRAGNRLEGGNG